MSDSISVLIVEDEVLIGKHLSLCLADNEYHVIGIATTVEEAIALLEQQPVDIALLDINLGGTLDGIDLAGILRNRFGLPFIYITSNTDKRTIARAKLTEPAGFIVKPFQAQDLQPSIEIALYCNRTQQNSPILEREDSFFIKEKHEMFRVAYADIEYAEAADNYTLIYTTQRRFMLSQTLKTIEQKLKPFGFMRIHRSFVVNVSKINCVRPTEVIVGEKTLSTSASARSELLKFIHTL